MELIVILISCLPDFFLIKRKQGAIHWKPGRKGRVNE